MSLSIRTNLSSINAQRNLSATQTTLDGSLSRLSSGFRITRAGDDAAGLGISTKLESQIRSYGQAVRNANDGLSVVQASEAALNEQASILTRVRELAMQSASDGVGNSERAYVQKESTALLAELQRISQVTEYNGTKLLDGSAVTLDFQVGIEATANDVISLVTLNGTAAAAGAATGTLSPAVLAAIQAASDAFVANIGGGTPGEVNAAQDAARTLTEVGALPGGADGAVVAALTSAYNVGLAAGGVAGGTALVHAIRSGGDGGNATLAAALSAFATAMAAPGGAVPTAISAATAVSSADAAHYADWTQFTSFAAAGGTYVGGAWPATGAARDAALAALGAGTVPPAGPAAATGGLGVAGLSLATKASALAALASIDAALEAVASSRATLGATGNRLQSAISNIQAFSESLAGANSRIKDVDVAEETSRLSRAQILAQAGVSVLAQANQAPQLALKLLG